MNSRNKIADFKKVRLVLPSLIDFEKVPATLYYLPSEKRVLTNSEMKLMESSIGRNGMALYKFKGKSATYLYATHFVYVDNGSHAKTFIPDYERKNKKIVDHVLKAPKIENANGGKRVPDNTRAVVSGRKWASLYAWAYLTTDNEKKYYVPRQKYKQIYFDQRTGMHGIRGTRVQVAQVCDIDEYHRRVSAKDILPEIISDESQLNEIEDSSSKKINSLSENVTFPSDGENKKIECNKEFPQNSSAHNPLTPPISMHQAQYVPQLFHPRADHLKLSDSTHGFNAREAAIKDWERFLIDDVDVDSKFTNEQEDHSNCNDAQSVVDVPLFNETETDDADKLWSTLLYNGESDPESFDVLDTNEVDAELNVPKKQRFS